jgi:hypothetical protein
MKRCSRGCFNASRRKNNAIEFDGDVFVLNKFGYYFSKRTKRRLHRVIWEQHHGSIPEGYKLYFKDGNKENLSVDNLYLKELNPEGGCDQCGGKIHARGKCHNHYEQMRVREKKQAQATKSLT